MERILDSRNKETILRSLSKAWKIRAEEIYSVCLIENVLNFHENFYEKIEMNSFYQLTRKYMI